MRRQVNIVFTETLKENDDIVKDPPKVIYDDLADLCDIPELHKQNDNIEKQIIDEINKINFDKSN